MQDFPGNSHKQKQTSSKPEPEKATKIVEGVAISRKMPLGKRVITTFLGGDAKSAWAYALYEIIIPSSKDMFVDGFSSGLERLVHGENRTPSRRGYGYRGSSNHTNYVDRFRGGSGSSRRDPRDRDEPRRDISRRGRAMHDFNEIVLDSRVDAQNVLDDMFGRVEKFASCGVVDLYDMVGITPDFTDEKWGWTDLRGAGITRVRNGYLLDLPRPEPLD